MDEKDRLYREILRLDKQFEKNKFNRMILVIAGYAIVFLMIFRASGAIDDIKGLLGCALVSIICAGVCFFINLSIFTPLFYKSQEENKILENLKKKYKEMN